MSLALTALSVVTQGQAFCPAVMGGAHSAAAATGNAGFIATGSGGGSLFSANGGRSVPRECGDIGVLYAVCGVYAYKYNSNHRL